MPFDPDQYLAQKPAAFAPDKYLAEAAPFDPDAYLKEQAPGWIAERGNELQRGVIRAGQVLDTGMLQASTALEQKARARAENPTPHPLDRMVAKVFPGMAKPLQATPEAVREDALADMAEALRLRKISAQQMARGAAEDAALPKSRAMQEFDQAQTTGEAAMALLKNPVAGVVDLTTNSLPSAAMGMAIGAAAGSETGPVGTAAGTFLGALAPEYAGKMQEVAQQMGVDVRRPEQIEAFFADPTKVREASLLALRKGVPIAVLNAATAGLAGRWLGPAMGKGTARVAGAATKEAATQVAGDALGEAAGQLAAGEKLSGKDILAEVAGGFPQSIQEAGTNIAHERKLQRWAQELNRAQQTNLAPDGGGSSAVGTAPNEPSGASSSPDSAVAAEIEQVLAAERAQADAQRAETDRLARAQAQQQRSLQELVGEALAPRVGQLEGKTELEKHDFWRSLQGVAESLAGLQGQTTDGKKATRRQLDLAELREQAGLIFEGAKPELLDAIAHKLHGSKPAESVAALRDLHTYAGTQRTQYAPAAEVRDQAQKQAEEQRRKTLADELARTEAAAKAEAKRAAQERARIRDTGRDLEDRVVEWPAVPDTELERLASAAEADGLHPDEITGAQAELERRGREEGTQQPLTREAQLRMIEKYGGINPQHAVHAGEIASIRESGIGKNKKLFREDGNNLDTLAQQIRQDVQNGPQNEAEVLEWLSELAAGRTPKLYERGEIDRAEYARSLPPGTLFTIQRPQPHPMVTGRTIPGFTQVDFVEEGRNTRSTDDLDGLRSEDYDVPEIPDGMPTGQYSEDQVAGRARWARGNRIPTYRMYQAGDRKVPGEGPDKGSWVLNDGSTEHFLTGPQASGETANTIAWNFIQGRHRSASPAEIRTALGWTTPAHRAPAPAPRSYDYTVRRPRPDEQDANGQVMSPTMWGLYNDADEYIGYLGESFAEARAAAIEGIANSEDIKPNDPKWGKIEPRIKFEKGTTPAPQRDTIAARNKASSRIDYIVAPLSAKAVEDLDISAEDAARSVGIYDATNGNVITTLGQGFSESELVEMLRDVHPEDRSPAQLLASVASWNEPPNPDNISQINRTPTTSPAHQKFAPPPPPAAEDVARRTAIGKQAQQLAKAQEAWRHPGKVTTARDMVDVARFYSTPKTKLRVEEGLHETTIRIERANGSGSLTATVRDGDVTVYAGAAGSNKQPEGGGSEAYQAIFTWAHNNGYRVFGSSLSNINQFRRTINMLSSALRHGSIKHLVPYSTQGIQGWIDGDTANNIGAMIEAASTMAAEKAPELARLTYDLKADTVVDQTNGHRFTDSDLARFGETHRLGDRFGIGSATARLLLFGRAAMAAHGAGRRLGTAKAIMAAGRGGLQRVLYARGEGADARTLRRGADRGAEVGESDAVSVSQRKQITRLERRFRRMFPALFADYDVRVADVERTLREAGYKGEIPEGVQAVHLPQLHAERDLIVLGLDTALRANRGLARLLHESGHAYWRMLSEQTRSALRRAYQNDLQKKWSPLWRDGELITEVSQDNIQEGDELGLEEWFSELMAATNGEWASRRYQYGSMPGWIIDLAELLRSILRSLWQRTADHRGIAGAERLQFLDADFRAFLTHGTSVRRTHAAGAQFAARFAAPQDIVQPKAIATTATTEDKSVAGKWIESMPAFQGGKYQMAEPTAAMLRQSMPPDDRAKITRVVDFFGGGGMWGSYLALTHFPNVQRITINELDPVRAAKIRLLHEAPEQVAQMLESTAGQNAAQRVIAQAEADGTTSGSALAARMQLLLEQLKEPHAMGLQGLLVDAAMAARGRAENEAGIKTAKASWDKLVAIARRDAAHVARAVAEMRRRGITVEVNQGDAYAHPEAQGADVLSVFDPPYYLTTGYDGGKVPLGIYERTAAKVRALAGAGNAIIYTDSAWWRDAAAAAEHTADLFTGEHADRAALSRIVDSLTAVGIVPVEKRHEIIGINRPGETHGIRSSVVEADAAGSAAGTGKTDRRVSERSRGQGTSGDAPGSVEPGAAREAAPVHAVARERWDAADERVRSLEQQIAALQDSQADDVEQQGRALATELVQARRELAVAHREMITARGFGLDPVEKALEAIPAVAKAREQVKRVVAEIQAAKAEGRSPEALLDQRDALHAEIAQTRRNAEKQLFPAPQAEMPLTFGDPNPPRNDDPPAKPVADGADEPDHLRPVRWQDLSQFDSDQLAERLTRLRRLADAIAADDLESSTRLSFLSSLVRDTREELETRRRDLEAEAEAAAFGQDELANETQTETRPNILGEEAKARAAEQERSAKAMLDAEAAAAIPDAPAETYPVRQNVEQVGAEVSATTVETRSGLAAWMEKVRELFRGFRSAVPELPTFGEAAQRFQTFREGLRLMHGLDEVVRKEAEEAVADITEPLRQHSTEANRTKQARLSDLQRKRAAYTERLTEAQQRKDQDAQARITRHIEAVQAEATRLQGELGTDPWFIFQNTILYGDLFTRSRLYRRDDGSPITLPGGLNPAEAEHLFKLWLGKAHAHPQSAAILEARNRHKAFVARIGEDLKARGFVFAEGANTNYFPHVLLEDWDGAIERVQSGTAKDFRGYLITPTGSQKPIETDYLKAMYYHAVQVLAHNRRADIIRDYVAAENIRQQIVDEAREANASRRDPDGPPIDWRQIYLTRYADEFELYSPDPDEIPLHPELVLDRDALAKRLGIVLGSGPLQAELKKAGLVDLQLKPGEIQEMLVAGARDMWVLPKDVAAALRGISRRAKRTDNLITKILASAQGWWKKNILFAPWNWLRFEFNNLVSDSEKILTADPAMTRHLLEAGRDVYRFITGDEAASDDVRQAFRFGVLDTLTAAEVQALRSQRPFEDWETTGDRLKRTTVNRVTSYFSSSRWNTMGWSKLREATFRFAKYKADLERLRNGATPYYAGAYWKNIEALRRVGAPEGIREQDRTGRLIGRQGAGTGPMASQKPYALQWEQGGMRREESYATKDERAKQRQALGAQQLAADTELTARKAAAISRATFGDYGELTPNGNGLRRIMVPFYAWTEVNFRYHANLLRNLRDQFARGDVTAGRAAGQMATQAASLGARAGMGVVLRLALPYIAVQLWNGLAHGDDEDKLSEEDRRRFHIIWGRADDGSVQVTYLPTALSDVLKWFGGNRAAQLVTDVLTKRTDWNTAAGDFASSIVPDLLNNTIGSAGPVWKIPYTIASKKSTFPDITDQRTIPSYDLRRVVLGQATDQLTAEMLEAAINQDYVPSRSIGSWMQQAILQVRRRDPEQWAFYAIKDKAAAFEERKTGRIESRSSVDAPDAQVLKGFRRAIYKGDIAEATRAYQRLLELGYTAERFESSVRAQDPLYGLPKAIRREFVSTLNESEQEQLHRAYKYYLRMQELEGAGRRLFPRRDIPERARERYLQRDRSGVLVDEIQRALATQEDEAAIERKTKRELQQALRRN